MEIEFFCPRWGAEHIDWDVFLQQVKDAGYRGIEWFPYGEDADVSMVTGLLEKYGLKFSIVMTVLGNQHDFSDYLSQLEVQLGALAQMGENIGGPLFISAQTGREYFDAKQIDRILACCLGVSRDTGIPVYQETHRNKWSFALHVLPVVLKRNPDFCLTLDISHWFCVSESLLEDQQEAMDLAISRTKHIHARIGHPQGSQVTDPALPQYATVLQAHLNIWDKWIDQQRKSGATYCTITPEFGPPPYLITTNTTIKAWEQQWNLNLWMKELLQRRYNL